MNNFHSADSSLQLCSGVHIFGMGRIISLARVNDFIKTTQEWERSALERRAEIGGGRQGLAFGFGSRGEAFLALRVLPPSPLSCSPSLVLP